MQVKQRIFIGLEGPEDFNCVLMEITEENLLLLFVGAPKLSV